MKTNNKIIIYLDGQMTVEEKAAFEKELSESGLLRDELKRYKDFNSEISGLKNIPAEEEYFVQMIPKFRSKFVQKKKPGFLPGLAYGATTATAVLIIMLFVTNKSIKNETPIVPNNTSVQQVVSFEPVQEAGANSDQYGLVNMSRDEIANSDSLLNSMLIKELDLTPQSLSDISQSDNNTIDIQTIMQGVDDQEADAIYKEILHKRIL
jgi:hypothetical protein